MSVEYATVEGRRKAKDPCSHVSTFRFKDGTERSYVCILDRGHRGDHTNDETSWSAKKPLDYLVTLLDTVMLPIEGESIAASLSNLRRWHDAHKQVLHAVLDELRNLRGCEDHEDCRRNRRLAVACMLAKEEREALEIQVPERTTPVRNSNSQIIGYALGNAQLGESIAVSVGVGGAGSTDGFCCYDHMNPNETRNEEFRCGACGHFHDGMC